MYLKGVLTALLLSTFLGCVGMETSYKPNDPSGGYGEEKLTDEVFVVFFDANGMTPADLTKKYFLRRAAQITLKNDYDCFTILEQKNTLSFNFATANKLAQKTKYYSAVPSQSSNEANKPDANSLTGLIQLHKAAAAPGSCVKAAQTIEQTSNEKPRGI